MNIGDKYFDKHNIFTIYDIYRNSIKVKFNNETKFRYLKKNVISTYRKLIPIGWIESFYIRDEEIADFNDMIFFFFPNYDSIIWEHSINCSPGVIKNRVSENILNEGYSSYDIMCEIVDWSDDEWLFKEELRRIDAVGKKAFKKISIYLDTTLNEYINLLQSTSKIYDKVIEESSKIIIKKYNNEYRHRTTVKEALEFLGLFRGIEFMLDIKEETMFDFEFLDPNSEFGLVKVSEIDLESFSCEIGETVKDLIIIKYWYDIDLNAISMKHTLIRDSKTGKLYIFIFNSSGINLNTLRSAFNNREMDIMLGRLNS